jgi:hypothetical protein
VICTWRVLAVLWLLPLVHELEVSVKDRNRKQCWRKEVLPDGFPLPEIALAVQDEDKVVVEIDA